MKCPRDQTQLIERSVDGIQLYMCPTCHGILIHHDQFDKIGKKVDITYPETKRSHIKISEETAISPIDGAVMRVLDYDGVKIDICMSSNFLWLDYGELETLFRKKNKDQKLGSKESFNILDAIDAVQFTEVLAEVVSSVLSGAAKLIDL